jgi:prolyl-tRNA editing enzyme YbaK/EbsC (Cys-tRNA(Pro) deacylase)
MSASKKITAHLGKNKVEFTVVPHRKVFTAYDLAQTLGAKLEDIAKTLLIQAEIPSLEKKGKHYFVVVLPASYNLDLPKLKKLLKAKKIDFSTEKMMAALKIKPGALTPFGSTRKLGVVVDKSLLKTKHALMGAESFTESLRVKVKDFVRMENPIVGIFGKKNTLKLQKKVSKPKRKPKKGTKKHLGKKGKKSKKR